MSWKERLRRGRRRRPTRREIARAQAALVECLPYVDPKHATTTCWACGQRRPGWLPTRAHIVPARYGAVPNQPHNYLLLCWSCHRQQPDASPWPVQLAWLLGRPAHPDAAPRPDPSLPQGLLALAGSSLRQPSGDVSRADDGMGPEELAA